MSFDCPELARAMASLGRRRPIFHSEADFQFALAWEIQSLYSDAQVRLELPKRVGNQTYKVDLWFELDGRRNAVELKYFKNAIEVELEGEQFKHGDGNAHDNARYDFLFDAMRMEQVIGAGLADAAHALVLTNAPQFWTVRAPANRIDEAFALEQGRVIAGRMTWADHSGGTAKQRPLPISLNGRYEMDWHIYSDLKGHKNGLFRWLGVSAVPADPSHPEPERLPSQLPQAQDHGRPRRDYGALGSYLSARPVNKVEMSFPEIEALVGPLPASARKYSVWWGNHAKNPQARWMDAGWRVASVGMAEQTVLFELR